MIIRHRAFWDSAMTLEKGLLESGEVSRCKITVTQPKREGRSLQLPSLAPGSPCPTAHGHSISPSFGLGLGDGPAYPVGLGSDGVLQYAPPANFDSHDWGGMKVLWAVDTPHYPGVVLIRGHQLDGPNELRFERGDVPPTELRITPFPGTLEGWTGQPSYTRVRGLGCYAYQIDGLTFRACLAV